ncbi:MAG: lipoprotein [Prevotella sp.]|nr:lipoprotein [Prevotella sp.]
MKKIYIIILFITAAAALTSCGSFSSLSEEDHYRNGYNMGVILRGGSSDEFIRK